MKTINTTLPVYNRVYKQCHERSGKSSISASVACPRHRLPSMQWNIEDSDPGPLYRITLQDPVAGTGIEIQSYFMTSKLLKWDTSPLPYSSVPTNVSYNNFTAHSVTNFDAIKNVAGGVAYAYTDSFSVTKGESITIRTYLTINTGTAPESVIVDNTGTDISDAIRLTEYPYQYITFTPTATDAAARIRFRNLDTELADYELYYFPFRSVIPGIYTDITDNYFQYKGDTLGIPLPFGDYYLKMESLNGYVYYSEIFSIKCIYPSLINEWTNVSYNNFTSTGGSITLAQNRGGTNACRGEYFEAIVGEVITLNIYVLLLDVPGVSGSVPSAFIYTDSGETTSLVALEEGLNEVELTVGTSGLNAIMLSNDQVSEYKTYEALAFRNFSENYTRIDFTNECDLGDIIYADGLTQTLWIESELMEASFPMTPEGSEDGDGRFIPTFRRLEKFQLIRTPLVTQAMVECLYRLMLHDTITIIDLVGDSWTVKSLEVEHEWQGDDKYYALAVLTFDLDEAIVIAGCCNNIT